MTGSKYKSKLPHQRKGKYSNSGQCFNPVNNILDILIQTIFTSSLNQKQFVVSDNITKGNVCAEVMWALEVLNCNYSLNYCALLVT